MVDFTKKENEDKPLPPRLGRPETDITVRASPKEKLDVPCNESFTAIASVSQKVESCDQFDFTELYNLAEKTVDATLGLVRCKRRGPDEFCREWWTIIAQSWDCKNNTATVELAKRIYCRDTEPASKIKRPFAADLRTAKHEGTFAPDSSEDHTIITNFKVPPCGGGASVLMQLTYGEKVNCEKTTNFEPFVEAAQSRAKDLCSRVACAAPCVPQYELVQFSWKCVADLITVIVYFRLFCVRPK